MNAFVTTAGPVGPSAAARARRAVPGARPQAPDASNGSPLAIAPVRQLRRRHEPAQPGPRLVDQIDARHTDDPGPGGWSGGFANQAHWDPVRPREWRCWAQSGPTWSAHCGAEVAASDPLGLCQRHRTSLLEGDGDGAADETPERALSAS
jgi:hypothetical protein